MLGAKRVGIVVLAALVVLSIGCKGERGAWGTPGATGAQGPQGPTGTATLFRFERFVDPVAGDDATADGSQGKPYKTIRAALDSITDAGGSNRYVLHLAAGVYGEPTVVWKPDVSARGAGMDLTRIVNGITLTAGAVSGFAAELAGIQCVSPSRFSLDASAASDSSVRLTDCLGDLIWKGGTPFPTQTLPSAPSIPPSKLVARGCEFENVTVLGGRLEGFGCRVSTSFGAGSDPAAFASRIEISGGALSGTMTLVGDALVTLRGVLNRTTLSGTTVGFALPALAADRGSFPAAVPGSGVALRAEDEPLYQSGSLNTPVTVQGVVTVDVSAGLSPTVTLPNAKEYQYRQVVIKRKGTDNVTVLPASGNYIDGASSLTISDTNSGKVLFSDGWNTWHVIGSF